MYSSISADGDGSGRSTLSGVSNTSVCQHADQLYVSFAADSVRIKLTNKAAKSPHPKGFDGVATGFRVINMSLHRQLVVAEEKRSRLT